MSSGHYCVIRDLGLVKGGKGLRHHEIVLDLSLRGAFRFAKSLWRLEAARGEDLREPANQPLLAAQVTRSK